MRPSNYFKGPVTKEGSSRQVQCPKEIQINMLYQIVRWNIYNHKDKDIEEIWLEKGSLDQIREASGSKVELHKQQATQAVKGLELSSHPAGSAQLELFYYICLNWVTPLDV